MDNIEADFLQIAKKLELKINLHTSRISFHQRDSSYKCSFTSTFLHFQDWSLMLGANYKDEVRDESGTNQNVKKSCKNKLNLTKPKDLCFSNSKTLKFEWKRYHFRLRFSDFKFECFYCCQWRVLPQGLQDKLCKRPSDPLS